MGIKNHFKLYKDGKKWCCMAIGTLSVVFGTLAITQNANAAIVQNNADNAISSAVINNNVQSSNADTVVLETTSTAQNENSINNETKQEKNTVNNAQASVNTDKAKVVTPQATVTTENGWQTDNGNNYYYKDGQKVTGQQSIDGKDYYFNDQGQQQKNYFLNQDNHTYYFQADGTRLNDGFYNNWGHTYYFQKDGTRLDNGFYNNWGHTYYFGQGGVRLDDGFYNNWGHTYYFQKDGARLDNGFYNNWGHTYYFGQGGVRLDDGFYNNWGHTYYFQKDGTRLDNGFYNNWGHTYYFGEGGVRWDNRWMNAWGNRYYFGNDGARITSQYFVVDGVIYFFDNQGIAHDDPLVTAWKTIINNYKGHNVAIAVQSQKDGIVHYYSNNPAHRFTMASTVKVAVLAQLLHNTNGNLNSYQQSLAERMIRNSDNNATSEIVKNYLGGVNRMSEIYSALGMNDTTPGYGNYWGLTTTTPVDQLKLLNQIYLAPYSNYLNSTSRNYIKNLMGSVNADQNWGISAGSNQFYVKNGWLALSPSWRWYVNSIGFIPQNGNGYTIAVYTDNNLPMSTGVNLIESLARTTKKYI